MLTLVDEIPRNATGKAQYPRAKELALSAQEAGTAQTALNGPTPDAHRALRCLRHRLPIFAFTPSEHVAAAVSNAGGLGVLGCVRFNDADELEQALTGWTTTPTASPTASTWSCR